MAQEQHLQLLGVLNELGEGTHHGLVGGLPQLVGAVVDGASLEIVFVNGIPVDEQVLDGAVIVRQNRRQLRDLSVGQTIVRKLEGLDLGLNVKGEAEDLECVAVESVLVEVEH